MPIIRRLGPFWRRRDPAAKYDVAALRPPPLQKGKRFETVEDSNEESARRQRSLVAHRTRNKFSTYLCDCLDGHYDCEKSYCPRCAREFRRYLTSELLRLKGKFRNSIKISTVLLQAAPKGELATLEIQRYRHALRKRLVRAGLANTPVIGGFEVFYRAKERAWVLHVNLAFFSAEPAALLAFESGFSGSDLYRPVTTFELNDPAEQLSYLLKFTTYHRPFEQTGPKKSPAKPLNPDDHYELVRWMAQYDFADYLFLFNARRFGPTIKFAQGSRKA